MQFLRRPWGVFAVAVVGVNTALFALSSMEDDREYNYLKYAQEASHASDRYYDAIDRRDSPERVARLKQEMEELEIKRDKYY